MGGGDSCRLRCRRGARELSQSWRGPAGEQSRWDGEDGEGLCAFQLFATISAVEARSNVRYRPRGGRYFIYRPPWTVDEIPSTLGPSHRRHWRRPSRPDLHRQHSCCWISSRRVPASQAGRRRGRRSAPAGVVDPVAAAAACGVTPLHGRRPRGAARDGATYSRPDGRV